MDFPFVKEALAQLFSKPSTIAFPAAPSPAKPNYRGRIVFHPDKCISCNMCERVCAGQAITHTSEPCEEGERITRQFYLGSCTFCSHCASFCTHGAIELSDDYHMVADYYHADTFEEGEEALIVRGTYIKKAPVKKAAPAAAPAAKPAAPKAEAKPAEEKPAVTADANVCPYAIHAVKCIFHFAGTVFTGHACYLQTGRVWVVALVTVRDSDFLFCRFMLTAASAAFA